ncbi:peptidase inhibitor I78 family protein [Hasllibacter halocynthiae]|uniref:Peptidase inhibitor I78 family protein n=1 Tax=Hasllibacter halocynthiae TaxID=595589 RepID=A0A2T0X318_9RHOB|nr:I78 family peptidase inhibitor [Hasllibacter halocynthiae]PRY93346.1 peptidase inhibitor I78 family protein [Hasllibacter halocynthiae]
MTRLLPLAILALAACGAESPPVLAEPDADACGASRYQAAVGTPLAALSLPADLDDRIIRPGDAVTQDYRVERINFQLDENDVVVRVTCG